MGKWLPPGRGGYRGTSDGSPKRPPGGGAGVSLASVMAVNEGVSEARKRLRLTNDLLEAEMERDHWEAEHAAIFHTVLSEDAAVSVAKAFTGYDDLGWARLEPFDRARFTAQGERVVQMFRAAIGG